MCSRRLEEIVNAMVEMKATCKDIMDGYKIPLIVQGPIGYLKAKLQNAQGNKKKAWILQAGTAVAGVTNGRKRGGSQRATSSNSPAPSQPALAGCSPQTASPFTNGGPADSTSYPNTLKRNRSTSVDEEPVGRHVPRPRNDPLSSYQPGFQSLPPAYQRLHTASDSNAAPQFSAYSWGLPPLPPQGHSNTTAAQQGFDSFTRASQQGSQPMYGNGNGGAGRAQSQYQYPGGYASNSPYPPHNDDDQ
ncbi:hypothetical protein P152DRAFT_504336 [Eremomyces bilateralis CBS 781.70]|uniref:Uncharacterized protein n=1 Tax=Eremomyces bilateralis CBS 781.70 TaxID=1392243 RepID=A0A6G1GG13_9PEZI|nr:uncharacterized protein P152DRAFT_504336 [Eremomyces bilateralis CBS 781.70]KAF1816851.1 hypothetical protein P152DRAFT_504336 [Eremomyces bilateralis CBS 781.70]